MKVIYVSSEISPAAKVGGLADVTLGLSRAIQGMGNQVAVVLPKYSCLKTKYFDHLSPTETVFKIFFGKIEYQVQIWTAKLYDLTLYLIDAISPKPFFDNLKIYGHHNDNLKFAFFSLAALEFIARYHSDVDIIHVNEWHTSLLPLLYQEKYKSQFECKTVLTLHNVSYQGVAKASLLKKVGLDIDRYLPICRDPKDASKINLLKSGIIFADFITTVSPRYHDEIKRAPNGHGLEPELNQYQHKLKGILNGIDYEIWNPATDTALKDHFDVGHVEDKKAVKERLRDLTHLPHGKDKPLVICICRLVPQKGISIIKHAIFQTLRLKGQFLLFGSSPITKIQKSFERLKTQLANCPDVKFIFESYNEEFSHQIFAGADMLIAPSLFEPCGLTQLIALRYGTVPIVRETGGLADTVFDAQNHPMANDCGNGFTFQEPTTKAFDEAIERAFEMYHLNPKQWHEIIQHGMLMNYSWQNSAKKYFDIYSKLIIKKEASPIEYQTKAS